MVHFPFFRKKKGKAARGKIPEKQATPKDKELQPKAKQATGTKGKAAKAGQAAKEQKAAAKAKAGQAAEGKQVQAAESKLGKVNAGQAVGGVAAAKAAALQNASVEKKRVTSIERLEKTSKASTKYEHFMPDVVGINGLFGKGVPNGAAVLIEGGPGSGKTIFCLQSCVGACKRGIKTLFMSFEEPEYRLREHLREFNFKPEEYERKGILRIKRFNALDIARSVEALLSEAKKELLIEIQPILVPQDFKPDVIFVDSLTSISSAFSGEENRFRIYMEQLFRYLEANRITSFLIRETPIPTHIGAGVIPGGEAVSFLSDGIIVIYNVIYKTGKRGRAVEILKMRGEAIKRRIVEMNIVSGKGMVVHPENVLKGDYKLT